MKPMLAARPENLKDLSFPLLGSFKLDGIRALVLDGRLVSRRLTGIKNLALQRFYGGEQFNGLDGELFLPARFGDFHKGSGIVRSQSDADAIKIEFYVFDCFRFPDQPFEKRLRLAEDIVERHAAFQLMYPLEHKLLRNLDDLLEYEEQALAKEFEGLCLRHPQGPYKFGRSTMREHWLIKLKRFADAEARIVGFEEQMKNNNIATTDALGKTKRSKHQENMVGKDTLGALVCVGLNGKFKNVEFRIAGGSKQEKAIAFDDAFRREVWRNQKRYLGRTITYTYFEPGSKDAPRHAGLLRFRDGGL